MLQQEAPCLSFQQLYELRWLALIGMSFYLFMQEYFSQVFSKQCFNILDLYLLCLYFLSNNLGPGNQIMQIIIYVSLSMPLSWNTL